MSSLRILLVEDEPNWLNALTEMVSRVSDSVDDVINKAATYEEAIDYIRSESYDLMIMDLNLLTRNSNNAEVGIKLGFNLLQEIRRDGGYNETCAILVVSAFIDSPDQRRAIKQYKVAEIFDKHDDEWKIKGRLLSQAGIAIAKARVKLAAKRDARRYRLTTRFDERRILYSDLTSLRHKAKPFAGQEQKFNVADLVRRADLLNWMIEEGGVGVWRDEARSIGNAIYNAVTADRDIHGNLKAAQALARVHDDVWLHFSGPPVGLGIPFELMRDEEEEPLALTHIITRHMTSSGTTKTEPFHDFINNKLLKDQERLRMLIVGANSDGRIPAAEQEAERLKDLIEADLRLLGIDCDIRPLIGMDAQYENVRRALRDGDYHIFHYCGHGHYDETLAERSGLVLRDGRDREVLPASEIHALTRNKRLRLAFLSACTSARTAERAGRGDFHSVFQALAKADVPAVIGYRWAVADRPAMRLAEVFYRELWRSFSPGEAMLKARQDAAQGKLRRDDDTWASPVMLMQNA